jgi:hypothetical protein
MKQFILFMPVLLIFIISSCEPKEEMPNAVENDDFVFDAAVERPIDVKPDDWASDK